MFEARHEILREEFGERIGQSRVADALRVDVDGFEDGLVEMPSGLGCSSAIGSTEVDRESERGLQVGLDVLPVDFGRGQGSPGVGKLAHDPGLFVFEQVKFDGTGGVGLQQLAPLAFERGDALALLTSALLGTAGVSAHGGDELVVELSDCVVTELDRLVVGLDGCFDVGDGDGGQFALSALLVTADAEEVVVLDAVTAA